MKKLRVLVLVRFDQVPAKGRAEAKRADLTTERDVRVALESLGHAVRFCPLWNDLGTLERELDRFDPHICFNLLEEFAGKAVFVQHVVSYLELLDQPYTGCNPRGLMLAQDKALTAALLRHHGITLPDFVRFPRGGRVHRPTGLAFPLLVKSLTEEGSAGISQRSVVRDDRALAARVRFIHRKLDTDALAVRYIPGRDLYVGVIGNDRPRTLPIWELAFRSLPQRAHAIATHQAKWGSAYQRRRGVVSRRARGLTARIESAIRRSATRIYQLLSLSGFARLDYRLSDDGRVFFLEANPNPQLARREEFAASARAAQLTYPAMIQSLLSLGLRYRADWHV